MTIGGQESSPKNVGDLVLGLVNANRTCLEKLVSWIYFLGKLRLWLKF
jgi:hypothetical protein